MLVSWCVRLLRCRTNVKRWRNSPLLLHICSRHQGVGQSSLVSCFPGPSSSPAGTHLGVSSPLPAALVPSCNPPTTTTTTQPGSTLNHLAAVFSVKVQRSASAAGDASIPSHTLAFMAWASIVHIVCMETFRRWGGGVMWTTCI